jgi:flagellar hook-associated protein 3 FlgL
MRVTNNMILTSSMTDLNRLREEYARAQDSVNGRVLTRPSDDPERVAEAMDLSGVKLRLERSQRSGEDAKEWLVASEASLSNMLDRLQAARETAVQSGSPDAFDPTGRESLARNILSIRDSLMQELNRTYRGQSIFAGGKTQSSAFTSQDGAGVTYSGGVDQSITRDVAPGLSVPINVPGNQLMAQGDFMNTLSQMAADLRSGATGEVITARLDEVGKAIGHLTVLRSDMGIRQNQVEQYQDWARDTILRTDERLTKVTGGDLETAVLTMTRAQTAYQAALASFSKALPTSLVDYMLR